jgi:hypothetical protein
MQSQQRLSQQAAAAAKKQASSAKPAEVRSAPTVLDAQSLRQVAGGNTTHGPYKTW